MVESFIDETFGEVQDVQRDPEEGFKRRDDGPYRRFIENLLTRPRGTERQVRVFTGQVKTQGKQNKGRGKNELAEAKMFQLVANEMGHGLKVSYRHLSDGYTLLRMMIVAKRTFTPEQQARRIHGQNKRRLDLANTKKAKAEAALSQNPNDADAKEKLAEAEATIKDMTAALNGKQSAPKAPAKS